MEVSSPEVGANVGDLFSKASTRKEGKGASVTQKLMPSPCEQYGSTVHLFIGTGRSPCKITLMPFTFINNYIIILQGLIWLFIFKSVPLFCCYAEAYLRLAS
jgi:hypothetical protein